MSNAEALIARLAAIRNHPDPRADGIYEMYSALQGYRLRLSGTTRRRLGREIVRDAVALSNVYELSDARIASIGAQLARD